MNMTKGIDPVVTCGTSLDRRKLSTRAGVPILFRGRGGDGENSVTIIKTADIVSGGGDRFDGAAADR